MSDPALQVGDTVTIRSNDRAWLFAPEPARSAGGVTFPAAAHAGTGKQIRLRAGMTGRIIDIDTTDAGAKRYWVELPEHRAHVALWARQIRTAEAAA